MLLLLIFCLCWLLDDTIDTIDDMIEKREDEISFEWIEVFPCDDEVFTICHSFFQITESWTAADDVPSRPVRRSMTSSSLTWYFCTSLSRISVWASATKSASLVSLSSFSIFVISFCLDDSRREIIEILVLISLFLTKSWKDRDATDDCCEEEFWYFQNALYEK